ncbi:transcriptional regulator [Amylibacter ulvae]|uniref:Transcriptional regulator n=1 Tax=Paramylibacter ulvae TaxID=1651968 RepID=A0ABQ3CXU7_9RHOB|nr:LysR family transcriptional regulator [Amylibacter ulvae]GHA47618.1 transcriptional regulator [Amylibacter ulvae]
MDWSNVPSLSWLRAFEATARLGSFSSAAQELNVTHAAIAQNVRALENYFAQTLVTRRGRGMAVTPRGRALADHLADGFTLIADGVETLHNHNAQRPLNISITPAFAASWLMPRIGEFWAAHPEITVNLSPTTQLVDLVKDGFDMGIRFGNGDWAGLECEHLTSGNIVVVARADLVAGRKIKTLQDICDLTWLFESHMLERKALVENEGIDLNNCKVSMLNTSELVLAATRAGLGMSLQPQALVAPSIKSGELAQICALRDDGLGYYMVTRFGRETDALRIFQKWLRRAAAESNRG